jgi:CRISPR system Cascade subunit CasC
VILELHLLQNFAPSNLNRDDTGSPKECEFGGYRRARISSQCLKRAIRRTFKDTVLLKPEELGVRTKRAVKDLADTFVANGKAEKESLSVAALAVTALGLKVKPGEPLTEYLVFLSRAQLDRFATWGLANWEELVKLVQATHKDKAVAADPAAAEKGKRGKQGKKDTKDAAPRLPPNAPDLLDGHHAADLALFGRMIADLSDRSIDTAAQVGQAISTHRVDFEFDYYTAIDDLKPDDKPGADMIGTVEFNSACYYRYANLSWPILLGNLDRDFDLARRSVEAFVRGCITAMPTGKQNSMAAHNPPSLVMAVWSTGQPVNLANAFVKPVRPTGDTDLISASVEALDRYWGSYLEMYGKKSITDVAVVTLERYSLKQLKEAKLGSIPDLVERIMARVPPEPQS